MQTSQKCGEFNTTLLSQPLFILCTPGKPSTEKTTQKREQTANNSVIHCHKTKLTNKVRNMHIFISTGIMPPSRL